MISELQISHSNCELEQLQDCITDVIETRLLALERFCIKHPSLCRCVAGRISRIWKGVVYEGDDGCGGGVRLSDKSPPWKTPEVFILHNESLTGRKSKKQDGVDAQKVKQVTEDHLQRGRHLKGTVYPPKINSLIIYSPNISGPSQQNSFLNN